MKIVLSALLALFLLGCSEEKTSSATQEVANKTDIAVEKTQEAFQATTEAIKESGIVAKDKILEVTEKTTVATKKAAQKVQEKSTEVVKEAKKTLEEAKVNITKAVEPAATVTAPTPKVAEIAVVDGAAIYKACAVCHGANAEKKALNKSQIIKGWDSSKIIAALNGYKTGTYGSTMKGVMKPQVTKLSDAEIDAVAKYISGL